MPAPPPGCGSVRSLPVAAPTAGRSGSACPRRAAQAGPCSQAERSAQAGPSAQAHRPQRRALPPLGGRAIQRAGAAVPSLPPRSGPPVRARPARRRGSSAPCPAAVCQCVVAALLSGVSPDALMASKTRKIHSESPCYGGLKNGVFHILITMLCSFFEDPARWKFHFCNKQASKQQASNTRGS